MHPSGDDLLRGGKCPMATAVKLMTAEEYGLLPDLGRPTELVRGRVVTMNMPFPRHGQISANTVHIVMNYLDTNDIGRVVSNDSGVITERDPDTVRGADVGFYSYQRIPRGPFPQHYLSVAPELVFEVRSPGDRWREILAKVAEYLAAGVLRVCVLDQQTETIRVYSPDEPEVKLTRDQELVLPDILPGFAARVERFFA
jgi:Uma2 family endonuclease